MNFFNAKIHSWYAFYKRDLPWRNTRDPYLIWLSEIIFQQTRIDQGLAYYTRFANEFPTISALANATEDQILKLWQGLGYYSRARNLHFTARYVQQNFNGVFPNDYNTILSLKGIGEYTAAAIASISYNLEYPAVDGNVYRILSRYFGIFDPIDTNTGKKTFNKMAVELIKETDPRMHNQALMEFGALQCTPKNPDCLTCPLNESCFAYSNEKISKLPVKQNKTKQRDRYFNYLVLFNKNHIWLKKRIENDIWKNLFEFPIIETADEINFENLMDQPELKKIIPGNKTVIKKVSDWKIHILSHQRIHYRFIQAQLADEIQITNDLIRVNKEDIFNFAVPKLLETYLNEYAKNV